MGIPVPTGIGRAPEPLHTPTFVAVRSASYRMSTLAALANSELSRLSHLIRRLERRGLVRREPDPTDGRFTHAILTDEGLAHLEGVAPGHVAQVRQVVFDVLDPQQQHALRTVARQIVDHLGERC